MTSSQGRWFQNGSQHLNEPAPRRIEPIALKKPRPRPMTYAVAKAIAAMWPNGLPPGMRAKERDWQVRRHLEANGVRVLSDAAVRRAVERVLAAAPKRHSNRAS